MANNKTTTPKDIECQSELKAFERNRYFYGKLLTVRDFEAEQRYFIEKQRLINRLIHGSGVVYGLTVDKVGDTHIKINPGVALDCCGREIVVPTKKVIDLKERIPLDSRGIVYVLLKYHWCGKEPVPNVSDVSSCEETCCYSRIMESYKIEISQEMPEACSSPTDDICNYWKNDRLFEYWGNSCPEHPEHPAVVLAAITLQSEGNSFKIADDGVDNAVLVGEDAKKQLVFSNPRLYKLIECLEPELEPEPEEDLTYITTLGWPHNGLVTMSQLREVRFTVEFSGKISSAFKPDENTFLVALRVPRIRVDDYNNLIDDPFTIAYHYEYFRPESITSGDDREFTFNT